MTSTCSGPLQYGRSRCFVYDLNILYALHPRRVLHCRPSMTTRGVRVHNFIFPYTTHAAPIVAHYIDRFLIFEPLVAAAWKTILAWFRIVCAVSPSRLRLSAGYDRGGSSFSWHSSTNPAISSRSANSSLTASTSSHRTRSPSISDTHRLRRSELPNLLHLERFHGHIPKLVSVGL